MKTNYDFAGWATKNNLLCSDGRIILKDAFADNDGTEVPLVWNHQHDDGAKVLGHALLENREEGVYAYGYFNDSESGKNAKILVNHGDIKALSIYANQLTEERKKVKHGIIREVSLVLGGANPEAKIVDVIAHGDDEGGCYILTGEKLDILQHADKDTTAEEDTEVEDAKNTDSEDGETVGDVLESLNDKQRKAVVILMNELKNQNKQDDGEEKGKMHHNAFEKGSRENQIINHSAMEAVIRDAKRYGSMKESYLAHADEFIQHDDGDLPIAGTDYGITNIENLFPDNKALGTPPEFYKRETSWVQKVMNRVHRTPFSRIKSTYADITADDARARGYITGHLKKEEVIAALKRTTDPTTIYKKQRLDRDHIIDITDFNVVMWIKGEMRMMLEEEVARAFLIGDGRSSDSEDKINPLNIRPIWTDNDTYTIKTLVSLANNVTDDEKCRAIIRAAIKERKNYKGSGNTVFYTTEDILTDMLLMEDGFGHPLYDTVDKLATRLRVKEIVTVPVMENQTRTLTDGKVVTLAGLIVDLNDYNVGADKGGEVTMFEDFDIDYNAEKYLIETRCSGALVKPKSAIAIEVYVNP